MHLQKSWVRDLNPRLALLKFRLPYDSNRYPKVEYLSGEIFLPVWGPQTTTEARLLTSAVATDKEYDVLDYNERMFYFNTVRRSGVHLRTSGVIQRENLSENGLCRCFDCTSEISILQGFIARISIPASMDCNGVAELDLSHIISKELALVGKRWGRSLISCLDMRNLIPASRVIEPSYVVNDAFEVELDMMRKMGLPTHFAGDRERKEHLSI